MISETDIQIGDWLHLEYTNPIDGFVSFNFKVSQLRRDYGDELLVWGEKTPDGRHFGNMGGVSKIQPIPLTPEILEKNGFRHGDGFEKRWYDVKIEDKKVTLYQSNTFYTLKIDEGIWPKLNNIYIRFVHELQHALRLCGIEKTIELQANTLT